MMCLCCLPSDLADQRRIDDEIEKELKNWGREFKRERKLLLLGEFIQKFEFSFMDYSRKVSGAMPPAHTDLRMNI